MKPVIIFAFWAVLTAGCQSKSVQSSLPVWLLGCWQSERGFQEVWTEKTPTSLLGEGYKLDGVERKPTETMLIQLDDAQVMFTASPVGQKETEFTGVQLIEGFARFENPSHDFPQRIEYRRIGDTLSAKVSTMDEEKTFEFAFSRCEAP